MNTSIQDAIKKCSLESSAGLLTFSEVLGRLIEIGVESYYVDYRQQSTTYYLSNNESVPMSIDVPSIDIPAEFKKADVVLAIRGAQSDKIRYPEFLKLTMTAGCMGYMVWITGRCVSYFGRQGEIHVEHFPEE